jgi:hypothetical protein
MLVRLPESGSAAHSQVLDRPSKAGGQVAFKMGYHYHALGGGDLPGDLNPLEMLSGDGHLPVVVSLQAVGDDDRRSSHRPAKAVLLCGLQVADGIGTAASIKGVGIGKKRLSARRSDPVGYWPDQDRIHIRAVSQLSEVNLDRCQVASLYHIGKSCCVKEPLDLVLQIIHRASRSDPGKKDFAFQFLPPPDYWWSISLAVEEFAGGRLMRGCGL